jgi:acyl-CoA synthetase (NDP forming)
MADPRLDVSGRRLALREIDWERFFAPREVIVVGATDTEGQPRSQWIQIRDRLGARGARVTPVHPKKSEILGTPAYPSVTDVPFDVDVAVILVRSPLPVLEECLAKGVGFAVVFSAGFAEVGTAEGVAAEAKLRELARGPMRVIGPNTNLNIYEPWPGGLPGRPLGIITQSGYQGRPITQGQVLGIGIEGWATLGNEADVEWADLVDYFVGRGVGAIASYVEGFQDGRALMLAADHAAAAGVPIVVIKVGRSDEGRAMAQAHTGHLTGSDAVHDAVFEQFGVIRVEDLDEVIEISGMFCHTRLLPRRPPESPSRGGVAVYAMSGGTASHIADLCGTYGVPVPRFTDATIEKLGELLPWYLRRDNPLDSGGVITARPENRTVLELMLADPNIDVLLAPITGVFPGMSDALARDLIALHHLAERGEGKPVVAAWISPIRDDDSYRALCDAGVPLFHSFTTAVRGLKALVEFSAFSADYTSPFADVPTHASPARAQARALLAGGATLHEVDSKRLLAAYGIPVVTEHVATTPDEAVAAARTLSATTGTEAGTAASAGAARPVVMKVLSADIAHKSDLGLVQVGVTGDDAVRATYQALIERAARQAPDAHVSGVVLQPMITGAVAEAILGLTHQAPFGPTITFGLGGIFTEVFADVAFAVPPFTREQAAAMIQRTRAATLLAGTRGRPAGDTEQLIELVMRLQTLAQEVGDDIVELDINPIMVLPAGAGVLAVDALVIPAPTDRSSTQAPR